MSSPTGTPMATPARVAVQRDASIESPQSAVSWSRDLCRRRGRRGTFAAARHSRFRARAVVRVAVERSGCQRPARSVSPPCFGLRSRSLPSAGVGGFLAGRLRVKWSALHTDEVFFRDTAHGFMAWAVATLVVFAFLSSAVTSVFETGAKAGARSWAPLRDAAPAGTAAAHRRTRTSAMDYFTDRLYRKRRAASPHRRHGRTSTVRRHRTRKRRASSPLRSKTDSQR